MVILDWSFYRLCNKVIQPFLFLALRLLTIIQCKNDRSFRDCSRRCIHHWRSLGQVWRCKNAYSKCRLRTPHPKIWPNACIAWPSETLGCSDILSYHRADPCLYGFFQNSFLSAQSLWTWWRSNELSLPSQPWRQRFCAKSSRYGFPFSSFCLVFLTSGGQRLPMVRSSLSKTWVGVVGFFIHTSKRTLSVRINNKLPATTTRTITTSSVSCLAGMNLLTTQTTLWGSSRTVTSSG